MEPEVLKWSRGSCETEQQHFPTRISLPVRARRPPAFAAIRTSVGAFTMRMDKSRGWSQRTKARQGAAHPAYSIEAGKTFSSGDGMSDQRALHNRRVLRHSCKWNKWGTRLPEQKRAQASSRMRSRELARVFLFGDLKVNV